MSEPAPKARRRPGRYGKVYADILTEDKLHDLMAGRGGRQAFAAWSLGLALVAKELTDGVVSRHQLRTIYASTADAANLVRVRLWDEHPEGWYFHNYVESGAGITRAEVEKLKRDGEVSACKGRVKHGKPCTCGEHNPTADPVADPTADPVGNP